jgi:hypothetical protein
LTFPKFYKYSKFQVSPLYRKAASVSSTANGFWENGIGIVDRSVFSENDFNSSGILNISNDIENERALLQ